MNKIAAPSVTVVVPTIRLDAWLDEAVGSVLSQDGIRLQLIVILDGIERNGGRPWMDDPRVTILTNLKRLGVGPTLRRAMEEADSEFVARLDADDKALPGRLAMQAQYLVRNPDTVAVSAGTEVIDGSGSPTGRFSFRSGHDVRRAMLLQNVVVQSAVMFRLADYRAVGGYQPLSQMEDYHLWLRLAQRGKIALLPETLAQYRVHEKQLSLGAKPLGEHIVAVLRERRILGKRLGAGPITRWTKDAIWIGVQFLRYYVINSAKRVLRQAKNR